MVWCVFDLIEWQTIDIQNACRRLNVKLHKVYQRRAATHESHVRALLCRLRLCSSGNRRRGIWWPDEFERMHGLSCSCVLSTLPNLLNRGDDVGVRAATTDVAAHQLLYRRIVG